MRSVSLAYAMITNIANTVEHHSEHCMEDDCGVSLLLLKQAAQHLVPEADPEELEELDRIIRRMPL